MPLLIVTHRYPPYGVAGVERIAEWTAVGFRGLGDEVTVLTRRLSAAPPVPSVERSQRHGVDVLTLVGGQVGLTSRPGSGEVEALFERLLDELAPDVVLATQCALAHPRACRDCLTPRHPDGGSNSTISSACARSSTSKRRPVKVRWTRRREGMRAHVLRIEEDAGLRWTARRERADAFPPRRRRVDGAERDVAWARGERCRPVELGVG